MQHLVTTFTNVSLPDARRELAEAHSFLVACCLNALASVPKTGPLWGIQMKRMQVDLKIDARPALVCKDTERFGEVVNMVATLERLLAALGWFEHQPEFQGLRVKECHPSTSSTRGSNDVVLADDAGNVMVRCEVCDVASTSAGQNGRERKDIASLGCAGGVPCDGVRRFICTSPEFACAIQSTNRKWVEYLHRYREFVVGDVGGTLLIELVSSAEFVPAPVSRPTVFNKNEHPRTG
jgi:hypothetical protein